MPCFKLWICLITVGVYLLSWIRSILASRDYWRQLSCYSRCITCTRSFKITIVTCPTLTQRLAHRLCKSWELFCKLLTFTYGQNPLKLSRYLCNFSKNRFLLTFFSGLWPHRCQRPFWRTLLLVEDLSTAISEPAVHIYLLNRIHI